MKHVFPSEQAFVPLQWNSILIDTVHGAAYSAIIYSLTETAKANNLKPYDYLKYLLTEVPKYIKGSNLAFLDQLLPWSPAIPKEYRKSTQ